MAIGQFANALYNEMDVKLTDLQSDDINVIQSHKSISTTILQFISRLKSYVSQHGFIDSAEEINFFKNIKPKFFSKLIYHYKVFEIQSRLPLGSPSEIKLHYQKELKKINEYLSNNNEFFTYYRSKSTTLDHLYFIRQEPESWLLVNFEDYETDLNFTTVYDHKLSKIIAYELLSVYISQSINRLEAIPEKNIVETVPANQKITWTGSKVSLIELLYALQSSGSCNNGTIDLKQLANHFEGMFNIELGNYYRVFQEIRIRKINRTAFLDQLKERLIQRMDESDLNPKFK